MQKFPSIHTTCIREGKYIVLPDSTHVEPYCVFSVGMDGKIAIGEKNTFYPGVIFRSSAGDLITGDDVSFGPGVRVYEFGDGIRIGNNCMIAGGTTLCAANHEYNLTTVSMRHQKKISGRITIGDDVWIGMNTVVHPNVTIGSHSIIGSGSVVTKDVPEWSIAYGSPCRVMRSRQ